MPNLFRNQARIKIDGGRRLGSDSNRRVSQFDILTRKDGDPPSELQHVTGERIACPNLTRGAREAVLI